MKKLSVVLVGLFDNEGLIMLNRRLDAPEEMWELVGGGIEDGDTPKMAILREVQEELNYQISEDKDELILQEEFKLETDKFSASVYYFTARFPGFEHFSDSDEVRVADLKLFTVQEALSLVLLPMTRRILE